MKNSALRLTKSRVKRLPAYRLTRSGLMPSRMTIRARFTHMTEKAPGNLASFEDWDNLVRQTVVWADSVLMKGAFGDPMELIREAQAADPEAEMLFALLDSLRDHFGTAEFTAKEIQLRLNAFQGDNLRNAVRDIGGDKAVESSRSLGRVLQYRVGRIVHGLRLTARPDSNTGVRHYRVSTTDTGFNGYNGFVSSHTESNQSNSDNEGRESNPSNPLNPETVAVGDCPRCDGNGCAWCAQ